MTGESDVHTVTPWLDRLRLQQARQVDTEFPTLSNGATASSATTADPSSSSDSSPTTQSHIQTWSAMLNVNAIPFSPKQKESKGKGKGKENRIKVDLDPELEKQLKRLQNPNIKMIVLMRGLPGSGKSVLADYLRVHYEGHIVSADNFFVKSGYYVFDPNQLGYAHEWCQKRAEDWASIKSKLIIVDNTNIEDWEMMPYARIAERHGYRLVFAEPKTPWKYTPSTLAKKNSHGVAEKAIEKSLSRFDLCVTPENLMARVRAAGGAFRQLVTQLPAQHVPLPSGQSADMNTAKSSRRPEMLQTETVQNAFTAVSPTAAPDDNEAVDMEVSPPPSDDDVIEVTKDGEPNGIPAAPCTIRERIAAGAKESGGQSSNWEIPAFPMQTEEQEETTEEQIVLRDSSSQTMIHDFAELELGEDIICLDDDRDHSTPHQVLGEEYIYKRPARRPVVMEKGVSVCGEELGDQTLDQKIDILMQEFRQATREHIVQVLMACQQNHRYARDILLGFEDDHFEDPIVDNVGDEVVAEESSGEDRDPDFQFVLDVNLAAALESKFGGIPGEAYDNLRFPLNDKLARSLYDAWYEATTGQPVPRREKRVKSPTQKKSKSPAVSSLAQTAPTGTLEEIMQFEEAVERSNQEQQNTACTFELKLQLAQRKQLYSTFPGAPPEALDAMLEANNYDVHETTIRIRSQTLNSGCSDEVQYLTALKSEGKRSFPPQSDCGEKELRIPLNIPPSKALMAKSMPQLREEMLALYQLKRQLIDKAKRCCSSKQYIVTTYYRQEAVDVERRIEKLAQAIVIKSLEVQGAGNVLDLHYLHVREALCVLKCFLELKRKDLKNSAHKHTFVEVITGYGASGTVPKIKPAVENYLKSKRYIFTIKNEGCYMVTLEKNGKK